MKKVYLALMCMASLTIVTACGGGNASKNEEAKVVTGDAGVDAKLEQAEIAETTPEMTASQGTLTFEDFSDQLKEACGVAPITTDKMTDIKVRKDGENDFSMNSPVSDESDRVDVQRNYFNAFAKVADGNAIYGFHMDRTRGDDAFKSYDEYIKFINANGDYDKATYGYDYKGKKVKVYCAVAFGDFGLHVTTE